MARPRIILADDHQVFAEGLQSLLDDEFDVVAIVHDGQALLDAVEEHSPDLVITDISMPEMNGIDCLRRLREAAPDLKVVMLTMHDEIGLATAALRAGASGYVLKNSGSRDVLRAVEEGCKAASTSLLKHISSRTVEFHKYQAMERIGVRTSAELIAYGLKHGIGPV